MPIYYGSTQVTKVAVGTIDLAGYVGTLPITGGVTPPISAFKLARSSASQTYSASQAGIFSVPTRVLSIEVLSVSGGSAIIYANSANTGTSIATVNSVGRIDIPGGYLSFLGLSIAVTGTISVRLTWETVAETTTTDQINTYDEGLYFTVVLTASRAKLRAQPCEVAGIFCSSSGGGTATFYDNEANSGTQIYTGTPAANQSIDFEPDQYCYRGLSASISGTTSLAVQVR